jgi:predicted ATPase
MVGELAQRHALSRDVIEGVSERTGGVPLFIEEVTRLILERGKQGGAQAIPPTLQQSLAARLDRLGPAREVAMIGAVLGRGFSFSLLRAVAGLDEAPLHQALDKLAEADILLVEGLPPNTDYRFKHALIQDAAYENLLKSRRQALHRRAAETVRDEFPDRADAEPEVLAHHFTQAGLTDAAIEYWGKAGDQALRRSAFQEAIAHLGKAIEMADKAGGGQTAGVSGQRQHLHVAYGNALIATRGYGAPETGEAFARARESAASDQDAPERLAVDYGLWAASFVRGELPSMRTHAAAFLRDVEARPDSPEASVAHRTAGITQWFAGEHNEAREHLERALALFQPGRDDDLAFRFGHDAGVAAMLFLALALWPMGDVGRAVFLVDEAQARIAGHPHIGTHAFGKMHAAMFELMRGDPSRATANAVELARLARERELPMWGAFGAFLEGLAAAESGAPGGGLEDMRRGVDLLREQNVLMFDGLLKIALAEVEAHAGDVDRAVAILDRALATSDRIGHRAFDAKLHRIRGEMLLKRDPGNAAPAEEAYLAAIAIAREQGARGFGLLAALSLAKLYQSTGRPVEAHDVLAPALEGFSPTPEMFEIGEAKALLAGLAETDEMKAAATSRQRRLQLQTSYSRALMWSRGFASEEAKAAFAKAQELAKGVDNTAERFDAYYGLFVGNVLRGELRSARETAETFRREAEKEERMTEAAAARRCLGLACLYQGDLAVARAHFEQALRIFDPERDREAKFRFSMDIGAAATGYLALTNWLLGEAGWAQKLIEEAIARAVESAHAPTLAIAYWLKAMFDAFRDDAEAARRAAESLLEVSRGHGLGLYLAFGALFSAWARARLGDPATGVTERRQALAAYTGQGNKLFAPLFQGRLAEFEAEGQDAEGALTRIDEALALAQQTGEHWTDAFLHRVRGDILFKADPDIPARAEDAYLTAIAIAREQGARSFALQAALKLAKLYRSTSRPVEAHDALAQALEGFSPTSELPEITEAQALLAALAESDDVKGTIAQRLRRRDLQTSYGQALLWAKGFAAEETMAAFARVGQFVVSDKDAAARIAVYDAQCLRSFMRGEYREAQVIAETLLREADERGPEAGAARRIVGLVRLYQGDLKAAQAILKRELTEFQLGAAGVAAAAGFLALTEWHMGEVDRARRRIEQAVQRANESADAATIGTALFFKIVLESRRDDVAATRLAADALLGLSVKHGMRTYSDEAQVYASWARGRLLDPDVGADELRQALSTYMAQGNRADAPSLHGLLAELEAPARGPESALALIDQGLAIAKETGEHFTDPYLHRLRAELLLKRDPSNPAAAEEAYRNAVAIAKEQGARSYELLVSLSLAKLYQSSARPAETHAALAPALEGFSPTPEMPEIGEALALLSRLA